MTETAFLVVGLVLLLIMLFLICVSRRLDGVVFDCGCDIRWIQLWLQRGEAGLHTQELYCKNGASKIRLHNMYIHNCGKRRERRRSRRTGGGRVCELHLKEEGKKGISRGKTEGVGG